MTPTELYTEVARMVKPFDKYTDGHNDWDCWGDDSIERVFIREGFYHLDSDDFIIFNKKVVDATEPFWKLLNAEIFERYNLNKADGVSEYHWRKYIKTMDKNHWIFKEFKKALMKFALKG